MLRGWITPRFRSNGLVAISWCWAMWCVAGTPISVADDGQLDAKQAESVASLSRIRAKASEFSVTRLEDPDQLLRLSNVPLLRYSDPTNGYRDAAVWVWEYAGFPVAVVKVEDRDTLNCWQYCVASLSPDAIQVSRPGQKTWQSKGPGLTFQAFATAPSAGKTAFQRLQIMKSLTRRFGGTFRATQPSSEQMRALPRPIHRFASPKLGVVDGTIFAFSVSGTNPTALVVVVLREADDASRRWEYGVVGMTADAATIYLDDLPVWSKKADYSKKFYDSWYFQVQTKPETEAGSAN